MFMIQTKSKEDFICGTYQELYLPVTCCKMLECLTVEMQFRMQIVNNLPTGLCKDTNQLLAKILWTDKDLVG